jgi:hypothetical protein
VVVGRGFQIPLIGIAMVVKREIPIPFSILPLREDPNDTVKFSVNCCRTVNVFYGRQAGVHGEGYVYHDITIEQTDISPSSLAITTPVSPSEQTPGE